MGERNARFWVYWNQGWAKLTVRPGETLHLYRGGATDEGFYRRSESYYIQGDLLYCDHDSFESDCDGRHGYNSTHVCPLDRLAAKAPEDYMPAGAPHTPKWTSESEWQRDHFAESMNY